jgi:hypothetical protein
MNWTVGESYRVLFEAVDRYRESSHANDLASKALGDGLSKFFKPGTRFHRYRGDRQHPWLFGSRVLRGNDRGAETFEVVKFLGVEFCPGHPGLSDWKCECLPVSKVANKVMSAKTHGADGNRGTLLVKGHVLNNHFMEDHSEQDRMMALLSLLENLPA